MSKRTVERSGYYAYIASAQWQQTRRRYFSSKLPKYCWSCGCDDVPLDLHHLSYKSLGHENLNHLRLVCRPCHDSIHRDKKGRSLWSKTGRKHARYKRLLRLEAVRMGINPKNRSERGLRAVLLAAGGCVVFPLG